MPLLFRQLKMLRLEYKGKADRLPESERELLEGRTPEQILGLIKQVNKEIREMKREKWKMAGKEGKNIGDEKYKLLAGTGQPPGSVPIF